MHSALLGPKATELRLQTRLKPATGETAVPEGKAMSGRGVFVVRQGNLLPVNHINTSRPDRVDPGVIAEFLG